MKAENDFNFSDLEKSAMDAFVASDSLDKLNACKAKFLGTKGALTVAVKNLKDLPADKKPLVGKQINLTKQKIELFFKERLNALKEEEQERSLGEKIDVSLPSPEDFCGSKHPLTQVRELVCDIFKKLGFSVAQGNEIETEWFCFDALNTPGHHPARNEKDTLFFPKDRKFGSTTPRSDESYLLRTHTSTVQIRTMLSEKPPLKIISPGRVFRRDTVDATHNFNFHQLEALFVDEDVSVVDLKSTLDYLCKELFGKKGKVRLRPSYFPFTEPSFEVDVFVPKLGKMSEEWIELWGCGMVNPKVFEAVNYDSKKWKGFAIGMGLERIAMLLYGIDDIRHFYKNDLKFLKQF